MEQLYGKPLFVLKPDIINGMFPFFLKNMFRSVIPILSLYIVYFLLNLIFKIIIPNFWIYIFLILISVSIIPLIYKLILLVCTKYYFFKNHVLIETKFINIKRESVPYFHITNIETIISLWDRFCHAGDIVLHTPDEDSINFILSFIRNPEKVEQKLYNLILRNRAVQTQR